MRSKGSIISKKPKKQLIFIPYLVIFAIKILVVVGSTPHNMLWFLVVKCFSGLRIFCGPHEYFLRKNALSFLCFSGNEGRR